MEIFCDFMHPQLEFKDSKVKMELDIWIPSISFAIEYQGVQHYENSILNSGKERGILDKEKVEACKQLGISLVVIPYTWDRSSQGLVEMIKTQQPQIVQYLKIPN